MTLSCRNRAWGWRIPPKTANPRFFLRFATETRPNRVGDAFPTKMESYLLRRSVASHTDLFAVARRNHSSSSQSLVVVARRSLSSPSLVGVSRRLARSHPVEGKHTASLSRVWLWLVSLCDSKEDLYFNLLQAVTGVFNATSCHK